MDLTQLKPGEKAVVVKLYGGIGFVKKIEAMGIRVGVSVEKISSSFFRGPVIVKIGNTQVALGFGMAKRIIVEK